MVHGMNLRSWIGAAVLIGFASATAVAGSGNPAADAALRAKAVAACNNPGQYPNGARPVINYAGGWFRCHEYESKQR